MSHLWRHVPRPKASAASTDDRIDDVFSSTINPTSDNGLNRFDIILNDGMLRHAVGT